METVRSFCFVHKGKYKGKDKVNEYNRRKKMLNAYNPTREEYDKHIKQIIREVGI